MTKVIGTQRQGQAFLVIGPESSGAKLVTSILIAGGCIGSSEHEQPFDDEPFHGDKVVLRRSVPHLLNWSSVDEAIDKCVSEDYDYKVIVCTRDTTCMAKSQVARGHVGDIERALDNIAQAYQIIFNTIHRPVLVSYESLVLHPNSTQESLQLQLELNVATVAITDENAKHLGDSKTLAVVTPFRNARRDLNLYFDQLVALQGELVGLGYTLRLIAAEGDSIDGTQQEITRLGYEHNINIEFVECSHGEKSWASVEDPKRLECMSMVMNKAMDRVRSSDDVVLWLMSDLVWKVDTVLEMLNYADSSSIITPLALNDDGSLFWDIWAYRDLYGNRFKQEYPYSSYDEEYYPAGPVGLIELSSAGTCLMMDARIARKFRADKSEAVSFCTNARENGCCVYTNYSWSVLHRSITNKRLLFLGDAVVATGFSRCTHEMLPALASCGYDIEVIAVGYWGTPHDYPYRIMPAAVPPGDHLLGEMQLYRQLISNSYDVVIVQCDVWNGKSYLNAIRQAEVDAPDNAPGVVIGWMPVDASNQIAAVELNHTYKDDDPGKPIRGFDHVVCWTEFAKEQLRLGGYTGELSIVPLGVDLNMFTPVTDSKRQRARELFLPEECHNGFVVGTVARNHRRKMLHLTIEAFTQWLYEDGIKNAHLLIHCLPSNPPGGVDLSACVRRHNVKEYVWLSSGNLDDSLLPVLYHAMDVYLTTTLGEGWGLPLLESMASGVPVIMPDNPAMHWATDAACFVDCSQEDLVAPLNAMPYTVGQTVNVDSVVDELSRLYNDEQARLKFANVGLDLARTLSWKSSADMFVREVENVVAKSKVLEAKEVEVEPLELAKAV